MNEKPPILSNFPLSDPQLAAALARGGDVAVTAGAGTGKTRTLVARFLALLEDGLPLRQIVAVTFTRKAAREMRNRVRVEIGNYLSLPDLNIDEREEWQVYYNELDAARIGTIHNLCAEILRTHPAEMGIDPQFIVLDETQSALLALEAGESTLAWAVNSDSTTPLFDLLSEQQLQDLISVLLKKRLAAAQVIEQHAAETILDHWQSKLQDFQEEAVERLLSNEGFIAAKRTLLQNQADNSADKAEVQRRLILDTLAALVNESLAGKLRNISALDGIRLGVGSQKSWPGGKEQLTEVKEALKHLREMYRAEPLLKKTLNEQDELIAAAMPAIYALWQQADAAYQLLKEEREGLDFDDLEAQAIRLLEDHPAVRRYWQDQVQAMLVDEFQDTNEQQCHLIRLLCPDPGKLFIVGDAKQSIYRFRGADVAVFAKEKEEIERQGGILIELDTSYRAHEPLLEGMNRLLRPVLGDGSTSRPSWVAPFAPLKPGTKTVGHDLAPPYVEFHFTLGTKAEALPRAAAALAGRLGQLNAAQGLDFGEIAILCRASGSFQYYENAFDAVGIPYLTVAGKGFYDRPEIRDLLNALQAIADPHDNIALTGLLRSPACAISDVALYRLTQKRAADQTLWETVQGEFLLDDPVETSRLQTAISLVHDLNQQVGRVSVADILKQFLIRTHYRAILRRAGQPRALRNVSKLLNDIHGSGLVDVNDFLEYAQTLRSSGTREGEARATSGGAVQIMSIHAAKGLEFPVIVLGDVSSGGSGKNGIAVDPQAGILFPYKNDDKVRATSYEMWAALDKRQNEAETARLLYVALTRAEQMLFINGYIQQGKTGRRSWKGWLKELADITGLSGVDLSAYDESGSGQHNFDFSVEGSAVRVTLYEPEYAVQQTSPTEEHEEPAHERPSELPLQNPVVDETLADTTVSKTPQRIWRVVPETKRPTAPAWVIGSLVHESLSLWRFPGPGFDTWVAARARGYGITDQQQLRHAQTTVARLLNRFQQSELYKEMNNATKRLHEVPYSYQKNGKPENGFIDALYKTNDVWTVVDFKSDRIQDDAAYRRLLDEKDYIDQLQQYGRAVEQLLGVVPRLTLCLLNYEGAIRVVPVTN